MFGKLSLYAYMEKMYYISIHDLSARIRAQKVSPVEVVEICLARIAKLNPGLNAFITVLADQAQRQARDAEKEVKAGRWRGPLHGIPVGIKDFYDTAGIRTTAAFGEFKDRVPAKDAAGVAKLKEAGAILLGKTNMHQLGMGTTGLDSYFGPVQNPWNAHYIPGGSSSGSAVAVASGMCYASFDTDAIGSCRLPAACCGVVGFKGTYGLVSPQGILEGTQPPDEMIRWLVHPGIITRSVVDAALMLDVLAERSKQTRTARFSEDLERKPKARIGVATTFGADRAVRGAFERAIDVISSLGHSLSNVSVPFSDLNHGSGNIEADRKTVSERIFKNIDVALLPTLAAVVPTVKRAGKNSQGLSPQNTAFANYFGLPAISVPCGFDPHGLPLGLQIVGKPWGEGDVLQLAKEYQTAVHYADRHPII